MNFPNKCRLIVIIAAIFLGGCASVTPIREFTSLGNPKASKISITSINNNNIFDKNAVLPGKIYVNSVFYGEFSKTQKEFTAEILPGTNLIVICPVHQQQCINAQINVLPNKNYKYE